MKASKQSNRDTAYGRNNHAFETTTLQTTKEPKHRNGQTKTDIQHKAKHQRAHDKLSGERATVKMTANERNHMNYGANNKKRQMKNQQTD